MLADWTLIFFFILMIGMNILIDYLYRENILFPSLFLIFEIVFGISIITINEIYVVFLMFFGVIYNGLLIFERRGKN